MRISDWSSDVCSSDLAPSEALWMRMPTSSARLRHLEELFGDQAALDFTCAAIDRHAERASHRHLDEVEIVIAPQKRFGRRERHHIGGGGAQAFGGEDFRDRKSTRLTSSH